MARARGIHGFESGDSSGGTLLGPAGTGFFTGAKRSGTYGLKAKATIADTGCGFQITAPLTLTTGTWMDLQLRMWIRPAVLPSVQHTIIGGFPSNCQLEMDTSGHVRGTFLTGSTAYSAFTLTVGTWYRLEFRWKGIYSNGGGISQGRYLGTITVYSDAGTVLGTFTQTDPAVQQAFLGISGGFYTNSSLGGTAWQTVAALVGATYLHRVTNGGAGNGDYTVPVNENRMQGPVSGAAPTTPADFVEHGTTPFGDDLSHYATATSLGATPSMIVGSTASSPSATKEFDFDDVVWDWRTGTDAVTFGLTLLPTHDAILPFIITAQGGFDQFSPAASPANIAEIPMNASSGAGQIVNSSTTNNKTTYQHAAITSGYSVAHIRAICNALGSVSATHRILIGGNAYSTTFSATTGGADAATQVADEGQDTMMSKATFDALEFGVQVGPGAGTLTVKNLLLEVLVGPEPVTADAGIDQAIAVQGTTLLGIITPDAATALWTQVSGPSTATILTPTTPTAEVSDLVPGTYVFRLTATFVLATASDDVSVTVTLPAEVVFDNAGNGDVGLAWVEVTDALLTKHVWAKVALPDPYFYYGGFKTGRILHWGLITRALSDREGQYEGSGFNWSVSDTDRVIRALLADPTTRYFPNLPIVVRMILDEDRRLLLTPRTMLRAIVTSYSPQPDLGFDFQAEDPLANLFSQQNDRNQVPNRLITAADFPNCGGTRFADGGLEIAIGASLLPVPIIYGQVSDRNLADVTTTVSTAAALPFSASIPTVPGCFASGLADGLGSFGDNERVGFVVTAIEGGVEGTFPIFFGINMGGGIYGDSVVVSFDGTPTADSYRVYLYDGVAFDPHGDRFNSTRVRFKTHDNVTMDGSYGAQFSVTFHSFADGTDALGGTTSTTTTTVDAGKGQVVPIYVGIRNVGGTDYHHWLVAGHACKQIEDLYIENQALAIQGAGAANVAPGGDWIVPGYGGAALYEDINGHRYSCIYGKVGAANPGKAAGVVPLLDPKTVAFTINVQGIDAVGDGTGALITDLLLQYRHAMQNWVLGSWQTGAWLATPVYTDDVSVPQMDDASFTTCSTQAQARVVGGYVGAFIIGALNIGAISVRDLVAAFNVCADVNSGFNRFSQFFISMVPDGIAALSSAITLTDVRDIFTGSFAIDDIVDDWFNAIPYQHTRDYVNRDPSGWLFPSTATNPDSGVVEDLVSQAGFGQRKKAQTTDLLLLRGQNNASDPSALNQGTLTAQDVIARRLIRVAEPPRQVSLTTGLKGLSIELGDVVLITHYGGIGALGWAERPCRVIRHETDPEGFSVNIVAVDLGRLFETGTFLGDETALPAAHGGATDAERRYLYLCDETTGRFGDGSPGQRLR